MPIPHRPQSSFVSSHPEQVSAPTYSEIAGHETPRITSLVTNPGPSTGERVTYASSSAGLPPSDRLTLGGSGGGTYNSGERLNPSGRGASLSFVSPPADDELSSKKTLLTLPHVIEPLLERYSHPRRRVSVSTQRIGDQDGISPSFPSFPPTPHRRPSYPRQRSSTMSFSIRPSRPPAPKTQATQSRKGVVVLLTLLSLLLIGTVIVLTSVSYWLAIPLSAYLTEDEVPWKTNDQIASLLYNPNSTSRQHRRQNWEQLGALEEMQELDAGGKGVMGADEIAQVWNQLEEEIIAEEQAVHDEALVTPSELDYQPSGPGAAIQWDVDGPGSGGKWMQRGWNGQVEGTQNWDRLYNVSTLPGEKIPRLIHQTWKDDVLPEKWRKAWKECREGLPDYEYMLWTDETSRVFVATHYPSFLHMFDSYKYPIQRADAIRYFILDHFGGIYMDLDIGCRRRMDSLLQGDWEVILPITKPVGVSNDLILSSKGSAFMADTVHALTARNHEWFTNYPTVMFSTGPMFLSGQYAIYSSAHPLTDTHPRAEVRILPKSLYGKNAPVATVPHSLFSHFYGSSWHADDAGFITFLGSWGKKLMYIGAVVLVIGAVRLAWLRWRGRKAQQYQLLSFLPLSTGSAGDSTSGSTTSAGSGSPVIPFSEMFDPAHLPLHPSEIASAIRRASNIILTAPATLLPRNGRNGRHRTGLLYFVPALFQLGPVPSRRSRAASEASQFPLRRARRPKGSAAPPPYESAGDEGVRGPATAEGLGKMGEGMDEVDAFLRESGSSTEEGTEDGLGEGPAWEAWDKDGR